jgi:hypothetical protein
VKTDAYVQSHLDLHIDDNIRAGMTPGEAHRDRRGLPLARVLHVDPATMLRRD